MDYLDTICERCREPNPLETFETKITQAGFSEEVLGPKAYVKKEGKYITYLFPRGIETHGTVLKTIPKKEKKQFEQAVNTLTLPENERYSTLAAVLMGGTAGVILDIIGAVTAHFIGMDDHAIGRVGTRGLSLGVVGAIAFPLYEKKSVKSELLRARTLMSAYMMDAHFSDQMFDPAIIKEAIGA